MPRVQFPRRVAGGIVCSHVSSMEYRRRMTAAENLTLEQCVALKLMLDIRFFDSGSGSQPVLQLPPALANARHELALVLKEQFEAWKLTRTEREVAMLLLKGLSFKEIASVRNTLEKTVRQQASAIYKKADVNGRHAFSAWFIEDLL